MTEPDPIEGSSCVGEKELRFRRPDTCRTITSSKLTLSSKGRLSEINNRKSSTEDGVKQYIERSRKGLFFEMEVHRRERGVDVGESDH